MKSLPAPFVAVALSFFIVLSTLAAPLPATDGLRTIRGESVEGKIASVHGAIAVIVSKQGQVISPLATLDDDSLGKVADFLASQPATPPRWEGSTSAVAKSLNKRLMILQGEKLVPLVLGDRPEPEFYVAYCSAHWCPPCRRFTPGLVAEYTRLQAKHPGTFELIFISSDESSGEQAKYARESKMPWPMVKYPAAGSVKPFEQWHGRGIPDLIVTNREGHVIFKSYQGDDYIGPGAVLTSFSKFLTEIDPAYPATRRARHRLEIIRHVRKSADTTVSAKPYMLGLNPRRYQTLSTREFTVKLKLDSAGKVAEVVSTTPELPAVHNAQFLSDAAEWLFLPAASKGLAEECTIVLPVKI